MAFFNINAVPSTFSVSLNAFLARRDLKLLDSVPHSLRESNAISKVRLTLSLSAAVPRPFASNVRLQFCSSAEMPYPSVPLGFCLETVILEFNGCLTTFSLPSPLLNLVLCRPFSVLPTGVLSLSSRVVPSDTFTKLCEFIFFFSLSSPFCEQVLLSAPSVSVKPICVSPGPLSVTTESFCFAAKTLPRGRLLQFHKSKRTNRPETLVIHTSGLTFKTSAVGITSKPNSRPVTVKSATGESYEAYEILRSDFRNLRVKREVPFSRPQKPRKVKKVVEPFSLPEEVREKKKSKFQLERNERAIEPGYIMFGSFKCALPPLKTDGKVIPRVPLLSGDAKEPTSSPLPPQSSRKRAPENRAVPRKSLSSDSNLRRSPVKTFKPVVTSDSKFLTENTMGVRRVRTDRVLKNASHTFTYKKVPITRFHKANKSFYVKRSPTVSSCRVYQSALVAYDNVLKNLPLYHPLSERLRFFDHFIGSDFEIEVQPLRERRLSVTLILPRGEAYCIVTPRIPNYHIALSIARGERRPPTQLLRYQPGEGLCYLTHAAFCCAHFQRTFKEEDFYVGVYPTKHIVARKLIEKLGPESLNYHVRGRQTARDLFHCDLMSTTSYPFYSLPKFLGGKDEEAPEITSSLKHKAIESAFERIHNNKDNLLARSVEKDLVDFKEDVKKFTREKPIVKVPFYMGESVQSCLTRSYPQFNLQFTHSTYSDHPAAAASRLLENETLTSIVKTRFSDIGGCPLFHIKRGSVDYHVCRPVYDVKDAQRRVLREFQAKNVVEGMTLEQLVEAHTRVSVCPHVLGGCDVKSDALILVQVYDASLSEIASAMIKKNSKVAYITMITPGELLDEREAFSIESLDCDVIVDCHRDVVQYKFGSSCYSHKLSNIRNIMLTPAFTVGDDLFSVEMYENRMGVNYYKVTRSAYSPEVRIVKTLRYRRACSEVVQVKLPRFDKSLKTFLPGYDFIYLDAKFVSRVFDYVVSNCSVVNSKTFEWVWSYIKSSKSRVVISGKVIHRDVQIDLKHSECFAAVMLAVGVRSRNATEFLAKNLNYYTGDASCLEIVSFFFREWSRRMFAEVNHSFRSLMRNILSASLDYEFLDLDDSLQHLLEYSETEVRVSIARKGEIDCNEENRVLTEIIAQAADSKAVLQGLTSALNDVPRKSPAGGLRGGSKHGSGFFLALAENLKNIFFCVSDAVRFVSASLQVFAQCKCVKFLRALLSLAEKVSPFISVVSLGNWLYEAFNVLLTSGNLDYASGAFKDFLSKTVSFFSVVTPVKELFKTILKLLLNASELSKSVRRKTKIFIDAYWEIWFESILSDSEEYNYIELLSSALTAFLSNSNLLLRGVNASVVVTEILLDFAVTLSLELLLKSVSPPDRTSASALYRRVLSSVLASFRGMERRSLFSNLFFVCGFLPVMVRKFFSSFVSAEVKPYAGFLEFGLDNFFFLKYTASVVRSYLLTTSCDLAEFLIDSISSRLTGAAKERVSGLKSTVKNFFCRMFTKNSLFAGREPTDSDDEEFFSSDESYPGLRGGSTELTILQLLVAFSRFLSRSRASLESACYQTYERLERSMKLYFFPLGDSSDSVSGLQRCSGSFTFSSDDEGFLEDDLLRQSYENYYSSDEEYINYGGEPTMIRSLLNVCKNFLKTYCCGSELRIKVSSFLLMLNDRLCALMPRVDRSVNNGPGLKGGSLHLTISSIIKGCLSFACNSWLHLCLARLARECRGTRYQEVVFYLRIATSAVFPSSFVFVLTALHPKHFSAALERLLEWFRFHRLPISAHFVRNLLSVCHTYARSRSRLILLNFVYGRTPPGDGVGAPFIGGEVNAQPGVEVFHIDALPEIEVDDIRIDRSWEPDTSDSDEDSPNSVLTTPGLRGGSKNGRAYARFFLKLSWKIVARIPKLLYFFRNLIAFSFENCASNSALRVLLSLLRFFDNQSLTTLLFVVKHRESFLLALSDVELVLLNSGRVGSLRFVSFVRRFFDHLCSVVPHPTTISSSLRKFFHLTKIFISGSSDSGTFMGAAKTKGKFIPPASSDSTTLKYERLEALKTDIREHVISTCCGDDARSCDEDSENASEVRSVLPTVVRRSITGGECSYSTERSANERANLLPHVGKIVTDNRDRRTLHQGKRNLHGVSEFLNAINTSNEQPKPVIVDYCPDTGGLTNSVREFYYLNELALFELSNKLREYYDQLNVVGFKRKESLCDKDEDLFVLRAGEGSVEGRNSKVPLKSFRTHEFCFRSEGLVPYDGLNRMNTLFHTQSSFVASNAFLSGFLSYRTFKFTNLAVNILLYEAPPGGGKTTTLIDTFCETISKVDSLILTANKSSQVEILAKVSRLVAGRDDVTCDLREKILTIDSYLMNNRGKTCKVLYLDECFMVHAGAAIACIEFTKCASAVLFGDSKQIHYIDRNEYDVAVLSDLNRFVDDSHRVYGEVSYRCPWDVCAWLSTFYPKTIATTNLTSVGSSSMRIREIESVEDVECSADYVYLTMLQSEKKELKKYLEKNNSGNTVLTVHEAQGETYARVNLVRTKFQDDDPFRSENHITVALSRHVESLTYSVLSSRRDDAIAQAIAKANQLVEAFRVHPTSFGGSVLDISVSPSTTDRSKCKASSAPYEVINTFLESVVPGTTSFDFGDFSQELSSQAFESGADKVVIRDSAPVNSSTDHDPQRV
nr:polyprotein 1a [Carnation yellow fleck virus]